MTLMNCLQLLGLVTIMILWNSAWNLEVAISVNGGLAWHLDILISLYMLNQHGTMRKKTRIHDVVLNIFLLRHSKGFHALVDEENRLVIGVNGYDHYFLLVNEKLKKDLIDLLIENWILTI
ncbi:hypothetical protein ACJX0J_030295 [Zea mays]